MLNLCKNVLSKNKIVMKRILILFCLLASVCIRAQQLTLIYEAIADSDYETALTLIDEEEEHNAQLLFLKAQSLKRLSRFSEAITVLRATTEEDPENRRTMIELAECYRLMGRSKEALEQLEQLLTLDPENKYVQLQHISLLCSMGQYRKAQDVCVEILKTNRSIPILRLLAQCCEGMDDPFTAIACYNEILEKDSTDGNAAAKAANWYIKLSEPELAIKVTEAFRVNDSTNIFVNRQNAQAYCLIENYKKAIDRYEYLMSVGDTTHLCCYYLGVSYFAEHKPYEAHEFLTKAHLKEPENVNILHHLARVCARTSWKADGVRYMNKIFELIIPSDSLLTNMYRTMADCASRAFMPLPAINAYQELYKLDSSRHLYLYYIADIYEKQLRNTDNTKRYLEMFLKTQPKENVSNSEPDERTKEYEKYYRAATKKLEEIETEKFFREGKNGQPAEKSRNR